MSASSHVCAWVRLSRIADVTIVSFSPSVSLSLYPFLDGTSDDVCDGGGRVVAHDAVTAHMLAFDMCVYYMSTH